MQSPLPPHWKRTCYTKFYEIQNCVSKVSKYLRSRLHIYCTIKLFFNQVYFEYFTIVIDFITLQFHFSVL
jgi:hypothetical protein